MKGIPSHRSFTKKALALALFTLLGGLGVTMAAIAIHGGIEELQSADSILVLGAGHIGGEPSPVFRARLDRALELYNMKLANFIILTGGVGDDSSVSDSYIGRAYLMRHGIPERVIVTEEKSRTTKQNIMFARDIMNAYNIRSTLLVSHDFHMMRAKKMASDLGLTVFPAPVRTKSAVQYTRYLLREALMTFFYTAFKV